MTFYNKWLNIKIKLTGTAMCKFEVLVLSKTPIKILVQVIARRFMPKQSHLAKGIASLRFTPLAMTIAEQ